MKFQLLTLSAVGLLGSLFFSGCNGVGDKDSLLARIDNESVYREDLDMLLDGARKPGTSMDVYLYENLYSKAALASRALAEYPEIQKEWDAYFNEVNPRILMMVYQRYFAMECLMYSESELRRYYDANRELFASDSSGDYHRVRGDVAVRYHLSKNADKFAGYLKENGVGSSAEDTAAAASKFADEYRLQLRESLSKAVREDSRIRMHSLPAVDEKAYYEAHRNEFMTVPGYELYQVQMSDSAALAKLFATSPSLNDFKKMAVAKDQNRFTAKDSGYVGVVKRDFSLPYGIGMVRSLSTVLDGQSVGYVTPVLRGDVANQYHRFYLAARVDSQVKDYDRVKQGLKNRIANGDVVDVDPSFVVLSKNGQTIFTEADLVKFNEKYYKRPLTMVSHERIVKMLAEAFTFAEFAKDQKLEHSWEYRAQVRLARLDFIVEAYKEHKLALKDVPEDSLRHVFDRVGSPFHAGYDFEKAKDDIRQLLSFPMNLYKREYFYGYRMIYLGQTFDQSLAAIYSKRADEYAKLWMQRQSAEAYTAAKVHLYDASIPEYKPVMLKEALLAKADSLYKAGQRESAFYEYRKVMFAYAEDDELFQKVAYEMAQLQNENDEFFEAEAEYYAFYRMWPENPNAEKAMFGRGFVLNENIGMNDVALKVFKEFLERYPNSELKESVDWLVKDIESNGKLSDDLKKKISTEP